METAELSASRKESLFNQLVNESLRTQSGIKFFKVAVDTMCTSCGVCLYLFGVSVCAALCLIVSIAEIAIGSFYINDCPYNSLIPVYLVVEGTFSLLYGSACSYSFSSPVFRPGSTKGRLDGVYVYHGYGGWLVMLFLFIWVILGTVWVYDARGHIVTAMNIDGTTDKCDPKYCNGFMFQFATCVVIGRWCTYGLLICSSCLFAICICCIRCCVSSKPDEEAQRQPLVKP